MRIAIIAEVYLPKIDGVVIRTFNLIRELQAAGDEVIVICPEVEGVRNSPVPIVEFSSFSFPMYPEYRIGQPDCRLEAALSEFQPDVIHFVNPFAFGFQCYDRLAAAGMNAATVFSFHTLYAEFVKRYGSLRPLSTLLWWQTKHYHNKADVNLTVSQAQVDDLRSRNFERVYLWQPAVDAELFRPDQQRGSGLPGRTDQHSTTEDRTDNFRLLTVSRLAPEKNVEFLKSVLLKLPEASLTIVGDGPHRPVLEKHFAGLPVRFAGYLQNEELAKAYATSDAFVYASETETMGNVILEAMASGLPVIAPQAGGIPSLVQHEQSGLLFEPGDATAAANFVRTILMNKSRRIAMIQQARAFAEQHDWTAAATQVRKDYSQAIARFHQQPQPLSQTSLFARATTHSLVTAFRLLSRLTHPTVPQPAVPQLAAEENFVFDPEKSDRPVHQAASPKRTRPGSVPQLPDYDGEFSKREELLDATICLPGLNRKL